MDTHYKVLHEGVYFSLRAADKVRVLFGNWRGEVAWRKVIPMPVPPLRMPDDSDLYPGEWVLQVYDIDRMAVRSYGLAHIYEWVNDK